MLHVQGIPVVWLAIASRFQVATYAAAALMHLLSPQYANVIKMHVAWRLNN